MSVIKCGPGLPLRSRLKNLFLFSVMYASNIGGTGTITGSPSNLVVLGALQGAFGDRATIGRNGFLSLYGFIILLFYSYFIS